MKILTPKSPKLEAKQAAQWVQDNKIAISKGTIRGAQSLGEWPKEYLSYHTSVNKRNLYKDHNKFFRVMKSKPQLFRKKFIFLNPVDASSSLPEAAKLAYRLIQQQASMFYDTGAYGRAFRMELNGELVSNLSAFDTLDAASIISFTNIVPYASTLDARALYVNKVGGIMFYAAKKVEKAFPEVGVLFTFVQGDYHKYALPYLALGSRGNLQTGITRPGKNLRGRRRRAKRAEAARLKANARTEAGRRGEYG